MFIIFGIITWLVIGFCAYSWESKRLHIVHFHWIDFLCTVCFGLISFISIIITIIAQDFPKLMERFLKKLNK